MQTPEQIADQMLEGFPGDTATEVYPYTIGWIGAAVESDRSDAEFREYVRASLAAADIVRQRLIERRRAGA